MINKNRIVELRRKNEITNLCKSWYDNGILIEMSNFLEIQETAVLQEKIMKKLDEMDNEDLSNVYKEQDKNIISIFIDYMKQYLDENKKYVFFIKGVSKLGGLVLDAQTIMQNCDFIVSESEYFGHSCSIFFCTRNAENGICMWKGEYDYRIYIW